MCNDSESTVVYVSEALHRFPCVMSSLARELTAGGIELRTIFGTENIWCRDWMPVPVNDHYVKFRYVKDEKTYPQLQVPVSCWSDVGTIIPSEIILDGGNVVRWGERVIMTDIVCKHNPPADRDIKARHALYVELQRLLEAEIIMIPPEPGDDLGHADGIVKWIDAGHVWLNDYRCLRNPRYKTYQHDVESILRGNGLGVVTFPFAADRCPTMAEADFRQKYPLADDFNPALGYYINMLRVKGMVLYPCFGFEKDEDAADAVCDELPHLYRKRINCTELSMLGGLLNCVSWQTRLAK